MAGLEPHRQAMSRRAAESDKGRRRRRDSDAAVAADALVEMARSARRLQPADPLRPTPTALVHVRVDHAAIERGHTESGEVCEAPGVGPVTVAGVQSLVPDAVVAALLVEDGEVLKVAHLGRVIPAKVRTALVERDRAAWCRASADPDLEIDHNYPIPPAGAAKWPTCAGCAGSTTTSIPTTAGASPERANAGCGRAPTAPHSMPPNPNWPRPAARSRARAGDRVPGPRRPPEGPEVASLACCAAPTSSYDDPGGNRPGPGVDHPQRGGP